MRSRRIGFLLAALLALVLALYTGEALYYYMLVVMGIVLVISLASLVFISLQFNYLQSLQPEAGTKGEDLFLEITLYNDTLFVFPYIQLHYQLLPSKEMSIKRSASFSVLPRSNASIRENIHCPFRGSFPVGLSSVDFCDIFGLFRITRYVSANQWQKPLQLKIAPRVVDLQGLPLPAQEAENIVPKHTQRTEDTAQINSLREYMQGDTLRRVHWKATARTGVLMMKEYELQAAASPVMYLDCNTQSLEMYDRLVMEDLLIECAAAAGNYLLRNGLSLDLVTYNPNRSQQSFTHLEEFGALLQYLTDFVFRGEQPLEGILTGELRQMNHTGCIYIITQDVSAQTFDLLIQLRKTSQVDITVFWISQIQPEDITMEHKRMVFEMRDYGIHVLELDPWEDLAEKAVLA